MNKWAARAIGLDALVALGRAGAAPAVGLGKLLGGVVRLFRPAQADGWLAEVDDAAERYRLAAERYGVTDNSALLSRLRARFIFCFVGVVLLLAWGIAVVSSRVEQDGWIAGIIMSFAVVPMALSLTAQAAFLHWQVRTKRLASFGEWLRQPGEWMPR